MDRDHGTCMDYNNVHIYIYIYTDTYNLQVLQHSAAYKSVTHYYCKLGDTVHNKAIAIEAAVVQAR